MARSSVLVFAIAAAALLAHWAVAFGTNCNDPTERIVQPHGIVQQEMPPNLKVAFFGDQGLGTDSVAVLTMIRNWGADMILHLGDFDYRDDPEAWDNQINSVLGPDYPYFAVIGNHDLRQWPEYSEKVVSRFSRINGLSCEGELGVQTVCSYKGLLFVLSGIGTLRRGHPEFIRQSFTNYQATWKVCNWHKNQRLYQTGGKIDETGYEVYDTCREFGAIVATGHEHSYARTHLMSNFEFQEIANTANTLEIKPQETFCFCSGLGGHSIRPWKFGLEKNPWWAATASESNGVADGVLLCTFNVDGRANYAKCFFQDTTGRIWDQFDIISHNNATAPVKPRSASSSTRGSFIELTTKTSGNDVVELSSGELGCNSPIFTTGEEKIALRFPEVPLDRSDAAFLETASIQVLGAESAEASAATKITIRAELATDSKAFECGTSNAGQISSRTLTQAVAVWDNVESGEDWESGEVWVSVNIAPVIQEVISQPTWKAGNAITLVIESEGTPRSFYTSDDSLCFAPTLALALSNKNGITLPSIKLN